MTHNMGEDLLIDEVKEKISSKEETAGDIKFFKELAKIEGVLEYFAMVQAKDMRRYFSAPTDSGRDQIKGHYMFAKYLYDRVIKEREVLYKNK